MGNHTSHGSRRLILPNGTVHDYKEPVTVAELMLEHPQQAVVEFQPLGNKTKPLAADIMLEKNKVYLMVPMRLGKAVSSEEARRILLRANAVLKTRSFVTAYTGFIPVFARMCPAAVVKSKRKEKRVEESSLVGTKPKLVVGGEEGFYLRRQMSVKSSWKPSLDTIKEKGVKAKIRDWLL
ncbi:hypothetical protein L1987_63732 [Smallanthus sonchifolius]|uniref:Uncharacterized protein n=1 Tax=Smallanthus sonchifolius TaxID=185202 RepID=A0ACB9CDZ5_9ASTR|nr:hypothetical protein L1987_63732 [Smallanthus sonchifolius]